MTVRYAVTFEFPTRAPVTHQGEATGGTPDACTRRAVAEARLRLKPIGWTSMVCVLLERLDAPAETDGEPLEAVPAASGDEETDHPATTPLPAGRDSLWHR